MAKTVKYIISKYYIELALFIALMLKFFYYIPTPPGASLNSYILMPYLTSYAFGFGSRFFIGSIIRLFTDFITINMIWLIIFTATTIMYGLIAVFVGRMTRKVDEKIKYAIIAVVALWFFSPFSTHLMSPGTFGRLELFHQILILLMIVCVRNKYSMWLVPILSVICIAIHQVYAFLYFASLIVIMFYMYIKNYDTRERNRYLLLLIITFVTTATAFSLFQFINDGLTVESAAEMVAAISPYTNAHLDELPFHLEYFMTMDEHFVFYFINDSVWIIYVFTFALSIILFSPLIVFLAYFWQKCASNEQDKLFKWWFKLAGLSPLAAFPVFILTVDYGRWFPAIFFAQFALVLFVISQNNKTAVDVLFSMYEKIVKKRFIVFVLTLFYLSALGSLDEGLGIPVVRTIGWRILSLLTS